MGWKLKPPTRVSFTICIYLPPIPSCLDCLGHQGDGSSRDCLAWCGWWIVGGLQGGVVSHMRYGWLGTCKGNNCHLWWRLLAGKVVDKCSSTTGYHTKLTLHFLVGGFKRTHFHLQTLQEDCPVDPVGIKLRFKWIGSLLQLKQKIMPRCHISELCWDFS